MGSGAGCAVCCISPSTTSARSTWTGRPGTASPISVRDVERRCGGGSTASGGRHQSLAGRGRLAPGAMCHAMRHFNVRRRQLPGPKLILRCAHLRPQHPQAREWASSVCPRWLIQEDTFVMTATIDVTWGRSNVRPANRGSTGLYPATAAFRRRAAGPCRTGGCGGRPQLDDRPAFMFQIAAGRSRLRRWRQDSRGRYDTFDNMAGSDAVASNRAVRNR